MTETTRQIFERFEVRKTKKQKNAFIEYVKAVAAQNGYSVNVEKGMFGVRNIVVGDVNSAKIVYGAHYDTCPVLPFPNFIAPKAIWLYILYQILIVVCFFAVAFLVGLIAGVVCAVAGASPDIMSYIAMLIYWGLLILLLAGPANKHTTNDNTSGVTTLLDIMLSLPLEKRGEAAFVFFDLEEAGLLGSAAFARKHRKQMKQKLLVNFDCVSDGEDMLFILKKKARVYKQAFEAAFQTTDSIRSEIVCKDIFYPSDQSNFKMGVGVAAFKRMKFFSILYLDKIHTKKDTVYREENIEFLKAGATRLIDLI